MYSSWVEIVLAGAEWEEIALERMLDLLFSAATLLGFMCPTFSTADHISGPHREGGRGVGWELVGDPSFGDGCSFVHDVMSLVILYAVLYCKPLVLHAAKLPIFFLLAVNTLRSAAAPRTLSHRLSNQY